MKKTSHTKSYISGSGFVISQIHARGRHKDYFWLNDLVGYLMAKLLGFSFTAHKWAHKVHHQNTNESHKDPDHVFSGNKMHDALLGCLLLVFNEYKMF